MNRLATFREYLEGSAFSMPSFHGLGDLSKVETAKRIPGSPPEIQGFSSISGNAPTPRNYSSNLNNAQTRDEINNHLERKLDDKFLTPYIALERVRKVLHPYGVVIQAVAWLNGDEGEYVFPINQWGGISGLDTNLESNPEYNVYMSWSYDPEMGAYDLYAAIVGLDQLDNLLSTHDDMTPFDDQDVEEDGMAVEEKGARQKALSQMKADARLKAKADKVLNRKGKVQANPERPNPGESNKPK